MWTNIFFCAAGNQNFPYHQEDLNRDSPVGSRVQPAKSETALSEVEILKLNTQAHSKFQASGQSRFQTLRS